MIVAANPALVKMFGYDSLEELLKVNAKDLYVNSSEREATLHQINEFGEVHDLEVTFRRKDGSHMIAMENSRAISDRNGRIISYEGTLTDITNRKLAEKEIIQKSEDLSLINEILTSMNQGTSLKDIVATDYRENG